MSTERNQEWQPDFALYGVIEDNEWETMREACWNVSVIPLLAIHDANKIAVEAINKAMGK